MEYYFEMLKTVLEGFHLTMTDLNLPEDFGSFYTLLRKSLVLEFLIVTVIKPILGLDNPEKLTRWHKETVLIRCFSIRAHSYQKALDQSVWALI